MPFTINRGDKSLHAECYPPIPKPIPEPDIPAIEVSSDPVEPAAMNTIEVTNPILGKAQRPAEDKAQRGPGRPRKEPEPAGQEAS